MWISKLVRTANDLRLGAACSSQDTSLARGWVESEKTIHGLYVRLEVMRSFASAKMLSLITYRFIGVRIYAAIMRNC
jgi:hypothetical protein